MFVRLLASLLFCGTFAAACSDDASADTQPDVNGGDIGTDVAAGDDCVGMTPAQIAAAAPYTEQPASPRELGSAPPAFALPDAQPLSCAFGTDVGLAPYRGRVTLVTLLSASCPYCQSQIAKLEEMRIGLELAGHEVHMLAINVGSDADIVDRLTTRTTMPVLQDTGDRAVWGLFDGRKDDIFVYDAEHRLQAFFRTGDEPSLNLSTEEGWTNVRSAILAAQESP